MRENQATLLEKLESKNLKDSNKNLKILSIVSGKGGVGKSTISSNLGYTLSKMGFKVGLFDADIGMANIDIIFNLAPKYTILDVLTNKVSLDDSIIEYSKDLYIFPGYSGEEILEYNGEYFLEELNNSKIVEELDYLILDLSAGIGSHIQTFLRASDEILLVTAPDPASLSDAYTVMKIVNKFKNNIYLCMNMVRDIKEATNIFERLSKISKEYMDIRLELVGKLNRSNNVLRALKKRKIFSEDMPDSEETKDIKSMAVILASKMEYNMLNTISNADKFQGFFQKLIDKI